jgi:hypothetical protein
MKFRALLFAVLLTTASAWGAGQLDGLRASAKSARDQVTSVRSEQFQKRGQLNQLSARIETLKADAKGKLLPGSELDAALKQSQELSGMLTGLAQTMSSRESELESANLALLAALSDQLTRLRADFDRQTDRAARSAVLKQFKALRAEREQIRAALPAAKVPALEALKFSDDPTELLEQADALRDDEDKVRRELKALENRIAEAKAEKDLDGRVRQFMGDESLFDDQDRRLRVRRDTTTSLDTKTQSAGGTQGSPPPAVPADRVGPPPGVQGAADSFGLGGAAPKAAENPAANSEFSDATGSTHKITNGSDTRPAVGTQRIAGGDDDDLEELQVQRNKLQDLATQLKARAAELDKKAAQLK